MCLNPLLLPAPIIFESAREEPSASGSELKPRNRRTPKNVCHTPALDWRDTPKIPFVSRFRSPIPEKPETHSHVFKGGQPQKYAPDFQFPIFDIILANKSVRRDVGNFERTPTCEMRTLGASFACVLSGFLRPLRCDEGRAFFRCKKGGA